MKRSRRGAGRERLRETNDSASAQRLVAAARRILRQDGFDAITIDAVIAEADSYRDAVRYHFGNKDGLIAAVVDSLAYDEGWSSRETGDLSGSDLVRTLIDGDRRLAESSATAKDFFKLFPHVLKDDGLRARVAALYRSYVEQYARNLRPHVPAIADDELTGYVCLMLAVIDGLSIQKALAPDEVDLARLFELWGPMIGGSLLGKDAS